MLHILKLYLVLLFSSSVLCCEVINESGGPCMPEISHLFLVKTRMHYDFGAGSTLGYFEVIETTRL